MVFLIENNLIVLLVLKGHLTFFQEIYLYSIWNGEAECYSWIPENEILNSLFMSFYWKLFLRKSMFQLTIESIPEKRSERTGLYSRGICLSSARSHSWKLWGPVEAQGACTTGKGALVLCRTTSPWGFEPLLNCQFLRHSQVYAIFTQVCKADIDLLFRELTSE